MDIESGEVKLILDEDGHCIDVKKRTSGESEAMIEEFMLLANQCAAHFARVKQIPFVYRVHEEPNAEKLERLHTLLQACGINDHFAKDVPTPKELSAILEGVRGGPYEQIINTGMLRCMSKAVYEEKPKGHYGLVLKDYAHFTSPIRRYPDLAIHRIMTAQLKGMDKDTMVLRYSDFAEKASKQSSEREIIAMQIERKAEDCYKAEYARRHLGECYEGRISGVTQRGLFIELDNGVEGFVPASSLTPSGTMLTEGIRLSDPVSGKNWSLGDTMMITIVRADVNLGKIDFEVAPASTKLVKRSEHLYGVFLHRKRLYRCFLSADKKRWKRGERHAEKRNTAQRCRCHHPCQPERCSAGRSGAPRAEKFPAAGRQGAAGGCR